MNKPINNLGKPYIHTLVQQTVELTRLPHNLCKLISLVWETRVLYNCSQRDAELQQTQALNNCRQRKAELKQSKIKLKKLKNECHTLSIWKESCRIAMDLVKTGHTPDLKIYIDKVDFIENQEKNQIHLDSLTSLHQLIDQTRDSAVEEIHCERAKRNKCRRESLLASRRENQLAMYAQFAPDFNQFELKKTIRALFQNLITLATLSTTAYMTYRFIRSSEAVDFSHNLRVRIAEFMNSKMVDKL